MFENPISSLSPLDYAEVQEAFSKITFNHIEMVALTTGLAVLFAMFNIIRVVKTSTDNYKEIDVAMFFKLIKEYAHILVLLILLPVFIGLAEEILGMVAKAYETGFGGKPKDSIYDAEVVELKAMMERKVENFSITDLIPTPNILSIESIDMLLTLVLKPFVVLIDNWSYGFAMIYRFIYLGALKLTGGIAIACYIYEPTRSYFYTWLKNLIICYLLIPGFLFVSVFVDAVRDEYLLQDSLQIGVLIVCLMAKIGGFAMMNKYISQSL